MAKARRKQIVVFLDDADQRSDDVQQQDFLIAQSMASNWRAAVFLTLRPETFYRPKQEGSLSAYHLKAFTISPPRVDRVLQKRSSFGILIATGKFALSSLPPSITVDFGRVAACLSVVKYTLTHSDEVVEAVDNLSGGNIRLALAAGAQRPDAPSRQPRGGHPQDEPVG